MKVMDRFQSIHGLYAVDIRIDQLCDEFEAVFSALVAGVYVWMMFAREFPISLLNLIGLGVALDPQNLIEIFFCH